jgi:adenosylhomocysteine nucleosidase
MVMRKVGMVAALEREVKPLVRRWRLSEREHEGHKFRFFEKDNAVIVSGGIGEQAARRATEAIVALFSPEVVYSVGFAGALNATLKVGDILLPREVIDARDGSRIDTDDGLGAENQGSENKGALVSFPSVADPRQKLELARAYSAQAVDMEAAAVARGTQARGLRFAAVKVISDEFDFVMPPMQRFISPDGKFRAASFSLFAAVRPWMWKRLVRLARNSARASNALCRWLETHELEHIGQEKVSSEKVHVR